MSIPLRHTLVWVEVESTSNGSLDWYVSSIPHYSLVWNVSQTGTVDGKGLLVLLCVPQIRMLPVSGRHTATPHFGELPKLGLIISVLRSTECKDYLEALGLHQKPISGINTTLTETTGSICCWQKAILTARLPVSACSSSKCDVTAGLFPCLSAPGPLEKGHGCTCATDDGRTYYAVTYFYPDRSVLT